MKKKGITSPCIVIHGNGGKNNMGDDAILDVILHRVLEHFPTARITIVCYGPEVVKERYRNVPNLETCYFRSLKTLKVMFTTDIYIIGGGGIINWTNAYAGMNRFRVLDPKGKLMYLSVFVARLFGAETNFYCIGATSFPDPVVKSLAKAVLPLAGKVSVRDPISIRNLRNAGIKKEFDLVLDPAFSLRRAPREKALEIMASHGVKKGSRPLIGLALRYVFDGVTDNDSMVEKSANLVRFLIDEKGCDVFFIPTSQHPKRWVEDDLHYAKALGKYLGENEHYFVMDKFYDPDLMKAVLGEMDYLILARLHAMILSCTMGVGFFCVSYDRKINIFTEICKREDIPIEPPDVISVQEFNTIDVKKRIEPYIDKVKETLNSAKLHRTGA